MKRILLVLSAAVLCCGFKTKRSSAPSASVRLPSASVRLNYIPAAELGAPSEPLPAFDAATITGDELTKLFEGRPSPSAAQYGELQKLLQGRKLVFHDRYFSGASYDKLGGEPTSIRFAPARIFGGDPSGLCLSAVFKTKELKKRARIAEDPSMAVGELVCTVDAPDGLRSFVRNGLAVTTESLTFVNEPEPLPAFDAATITGDELVELLKTMKDGLSPAARLELAERLEGRELMFSDVRVQSCKRKTDGTADVICTVELGRIPVPGPSIGYRVSQLSLCVNCPIADLDALPWDPSGFGSSLSNLTGRISRQRDWFASPRDVLVLRDARFAAPWREEKLPEIDAETMTGDKFVETVQKFDSMSRKVMAERLARVLVGRRLTFSSCEVTSVDEGWGRSKSWTVSLGFDPKDKWGDFGFKLRARFPASAKSEVRGLSVGMKVTDVSGTVALETEGTSGWLLYLKDVEWTVGEPEALPEINPETFTGDDLIALAKSRKTGFSLRQVKSISKALQGKRLTLEFGREDCRVMGCSRSRDAYDSLTIEFPSGLGPRPSCSFDVAFTLRTPISENDFDRGYGKKFRATGTVTDKGSSFRGLGKLVFEDVVLEEVKP